MPYKKLRSYKQAAPFIIWLTNPRPLSRHVFRSIRGQWMPHAALAISALAMVRPSSLWHFVTSWSCLLLLPNYLLLICLTLEIVLKWRPRLEMPNSGGKYLNFCRPFVHIFFFIYGNWKYGIFPYGLMWLMCLQIGLKVLLPPTYFSGMFF